MRALILTAWLAAGSPPACAAELEGSRWKMRFWAAASWIPFWKGDVMRFEKGRFTSSECASYGFAPAPYLEKAAKDGTTWTASQRNSDGERARWTGRLEGDRMSGELIWERPDGLTRRYRFSARQDSER
jgi:hypothetical protein